jgi:hypothetical protein
MRRTRNPFARNPPSKSKRRRPPTTPNDNEHFDKAKNRTTGLEIERKGERLLFDDIHFDIHQKEKKSFLSSNYRGFLGLCRITPKYTALLLFVVI